MWITGPGEPVNVTVDQGLPNNEVNAIAFTPGDVAWIGTTGGLAAFDGARITAVFTMVTSGFASDNVTALYIAADGALWVGTWWGLSVRSPDGSWVHFRNGETFGESMDDVTDIAEDAAGNVWVTTSGDGIYRYRNGEWQHFSTNDQASALPSDYINGVTLAPDGSLWFGFDWDGAARFDGQSWSFYDVSDGLIHPNVADIYVDTSGTVWFATGGGATRYQP